MYYYNVTITGTTTDEYRTIALPENVDKFDISVWTNSLSIKRQRLDAGWDDAIEVSVNNGSPVYKIECLTRAIQVKNKGTGNPSRFQIVAWILGGAW